MATQRFPFRFDPRYEKAAKPFGVTPQRAYVEVGDGRFVARYGPWRIDTPIGNVSRTEVTGPYAFAKTAGPARLALTDTGVTFASNGERGVCVSFKDHIPGAGPFRLLPGRHRHCEVTVTVADPEGLVAAIGAEAARPVGPARG